MRRAVAKRLLQTPTDVSDGLAADLALGYVLSVTTSTYGEVKAKEVVSIPHMGNPGLFGRQFEPACFPKEIPDLVP